MKETRVFRMHEKLLMDVIRRQAGSLGKAVLEAVMNAVDAAAGFADITLTSDRLVVTDNGGGFKNKQSILTLFEVFGQPHEEGENKVYGTFRMGRGQLFAYGANQWKTGRFRMSVDVQNRGLDYDLHEVDDDVPGCIVAVTLYEPLGLVGIDEVKRDLAKWCRWAPITVKFNGQQLNRDAAGAKWDHTTDEAYIRLSAGAGGSLSVYNLGIHVCEIPAYRFGCGGEVVSRKQLRVNFARNDIQSDCPVWRKVRPLLDKMATAGNLKRNALDDDGRQRLADQLRRGEVVAGAGCDKKLFTAVTGRHFSAGQIINNVYRCNVFSASHKGDRRGDDIMRAGIAFIFAAETLDRFGFTRTSDLLSWLKKTFDEFDRFSFVCKPFEELAAALKENHSIVAEKDLRPREKLWLSVLSKAANKLQVNDKCVIGWSSDARKLVIGEAELSGGWTDGRTYVAINRKWLADRAPDVAGLTAAGCLLAHEICHGEASFADHDHDQTFYEQFHDCVSHSLGGFIQEAVLAVRASAHRLTKKVKKDLDAQDEAARKTAELSAVAARSR